MVTIDLILNNVIKNANEAIFTAEMASILIQTRWRNNFTLSDEVIDRVAKRAVELLEKQIFLAKLSIRRLSPIPLNLCTGTFRISMGMPCCHTIKEHLQGNANWQIPINMIDSHWLYRRTQMDDAIEDPFRAIREPAVARRYGRPPPPLPELRNVLIVSPAGVVSTPGSQAPRDTSSRREPGAFEAAEREDAARGRGRGRGGRGAWVGMGTGDVPGDTRRTSAGAMFMTLDL
ncbi:hypothetical protein P152DRAFT_489234 [Eremomyces bilateralis CBS 781.70]|uniref:Uncharacterized protein n=1 Tax=Eremomyces bilateralis CBS 781.70 TaxID=1392243 RepID=A0A6G1G0R2_9PEZI|nr:uncharacterized protein P152DRAFT_489234 [Eremomyces bilateralis CBS 781.70]KAF1811516.1 hypothetical protein P152DRAFT_489234 [Eremomyces bilateralis CBS 781.70]